MSAPDVRMYNQRRTFIANSVAIQINSLIQDAERLRRDIDKGGKVFASQARGLVDAAARLSERLAALEAFDELSFLADAQEVPR